MLAHPAACHACQLAPEQCACAAQTGMVHPGARITRGPAAAGQALAYWRQQVAGAPQQLDLPTDAPPPAAVSGHSGSVLAALPPALTGALRRVAGAADATLFEVLLAAWQVST